MSLVYPSGTNTFVPSLEATGQLQTTYSRNPKKFAVNRYASIVPVDKNVGHYILHDADEPSRVVKEEGFVWADGAAAMDNLIQLGFEFPSYATTRYAYPFSLGELSLEQAEWPIVASHANAAASVAMTVRTKKALDVAIAEITATDTATNLGGAKWDVGTTAAPSLRKGIQNVIEKIVLATNGVVGPSDINMVLNPTDARLIAASQEVVDFVKGSPFVVDSLQGSDVWNTYGLPPVLFGVNVSVEDAVRVTSKKGATRAASFVLPSGTILFLGRVGELEAVNGTYSALVCFEKENMTAELYNDTLNRRTVGRVVDDFQYKLASPVSSYKVTAATA